MSYVVYLLWFSIQSRIICCIPLSLNYPLPCSTVPHLSLSGFLLATLHSLRDLSSLTSNWIQAVKEWSSNHWIAREFPVLTFSEEFESVVLQNVHHIRFACACSVAQCVRLFSTVWTVARQTPPSVEFSRQEYWIGLPFPYLGDLLDPGIKPVSPAWWASSLPLCHIGSPRFSSWVLMIRCR